MKKGIFRKAVSMALVCVMAFGTMTGCGKTTSESGSNMENETNGGTNGENESKAKGRYVEKAVELSFADDEEGIALFRDKEGGYKLYTYLSGEKQYQSYKSADGTSFEEDNSADWLNEALGGTDVYMKTIFQGEDGKDYALYYKDDNHLIQENEDGSPVEMLSEVFQQKMGVDMAGVMENGNVVTSDAITGKLEVWSLQDGRCLNEIEQGGSQTSGIKVFDYKEGKAVALSKNSNGLSVFNLETGETEQDMVLDGFEINSDSPGIPRFGKEEDCFYLNRQGIHHISKNAGTVETLLEGDLASMGDSTMDIIDFALGDDNDFYALYNQERKAKLFYYVYDEEANVTPDDQLVIYGLEENKTIKQAVSSFQKEHPEISVRYKTGSQQESGTTRADQIRVLNTELLGGNGADILVLDGLPLESYIEKGVLLDLSDFFEELEGESPLSDNIIESMKDGNGLYKFPARVDVLSMFGTEEETKAMLSIDSLADYLETGDPKDLLNVTSYEYYLRLLLTMNYKDLFSEEEEQIPEEKLSKLLETTKNLGDAIGAEGYSTMEFYLNRLPDMTEETIVKEMGGTDFITSVDNGNEMNVRNGKKQAVVKQLTGSMDMMVPCEVIKETGLTPQGIHGLYIPKGMVGINAASQKKELAQEFLKLLFSEELQTLDLYDGFPVNETSMENWCQREPSEGGMSIGTSDENGESFSASEPTGEQISPFVQIEWEADTPVIIDEAILEVMIDEGISYFKNEKSLEEAVQAITNKTKTYLAE